MVCPSVVIEVDPWLQRELLGEFTAFEIKHFKGQSGSNLFLAFVLFLVTFRENY